MAERYAEIAFDAMKYEVYWTMDDIEEYRINTIKEAFIEGYKQKERDMEDKYKQ